MISNLLEKLPPEDYLKIRDAFENEYTVMINVPETNFWVGVNVPLDRPTLAREGHYSYGEKS